MERQKQQPGAPEQRRPEGAEMRQISILSPVVTPTGEDGECSISGCMKHGKETAEIMSDLLADRAIVEFKNQRIIVRLDPTNPSNIGTESSQVCLDHLMEAGRIILQGMRKARDSSE